MVAQDQVYENSVDQEFNAVVAQEHGEEDRLQNPQNIGIQHDDEGFNGEPIDDEEVGGEPVQEEADHGDGNGGRLGNSPTQSEEPPEPVPNQPRGVPEASPDAPSSPRLPQNDGEVHPSKDAFALKSGLFFNDQNRGFMLRVGPELEIKESFPFVRIPKLKFNLQFTLGAENPVPTNGGFYLGGQLKANKILVDQTFYFPRKNYQFYSKTLVRPNLVRPNPAVFVNRFGYQYRSNVKSSINNTSISPGRHSLAYNLQSQVGFLGFEGGGEIELKQLCFGKTPVVGPMANPTGNSTSLDKVFMSLKRIENEQHLHTKKAEETLKLSKVTNKNVKVLDKQSKGLKKSLDTVTHQTTNTYTAVQQLQTQVALVASPSVSLSKSTQPASWFGAGFLTIGVFLGGFSLYILKKIQRSKKPDNRVKLLPPPKE